jgi:hypothetical protein
MIHEEVVEAVGKNMPNDELLLDLADLFKEL